MIDETVLDPPDDLFGSKSQIQTEVLNDDGFAESNLLDLLLVAHLLRNTVSILKGLLLRLQLGFRFNYPLESVPARSVFSSSVLSFLLEIRMNFFFFGRSF